MHGGEGADVRPHCALEGAVRGLGQHACISCASLISEGGLHFLHRILPRRQGAIIKVFLPDLFVESCRIIRQLAVAVSLAVLRLLSLHLGTAVRFEHAVGLAISLAPRLGL